LTKPRLLKALAENQSAVPPHDPIVERAVLASMYLSPDACYEALQTTKPECFYSPRHQRLFKALRNMFEEGQDTTDLVLIHTTLERDGQDDLDTPWNWVVDIFKNTVPLGLGRNIKEYVKSLNWYYIQRRKGEMTLEAWDLYRTGLVVEGDALLTQVNELKVSDIDLAPNRDVEIETAKKQIEEEYMGGIVGCTTGLVALDRMTGGFRPYYTYVVGGLTSIGKSACALQMVLAAALGGTHVWYFSFEMAGPEIRKRLAAMLSRVPIKSGNIRNLRPDQMELVRESLDKLKQIPITIDTKTRDIDAMARLAKKHRGEVGLYVVDHIRLVSVTGNSSEYEKLSRISGVCKSGIAGDGEAAVLMLSQLNREAAKDGKQGETHQLRGSGAIEEDADYVMIVKRKSYGSQVVSDEASLEVKKNRPGGETGSIRLYWNKNLGMFEESSESGPY